MKITISGLTDSTISFNTLGIILRGKESAYHITPKNDEQMREIISMKNSRLISIYQEDEEKQFAPQIKPEMVFINKVENEVQEKKLPQTPELKTNAAKQLPKQSISIKSKAKVITKIEREEEPPENDDVIVVTEAGVKKGKSKTNFLKGTEETEATRASIEALRLLEEEENAPTEEVVFDDANLDPSERMGGLAVISTGSKNAQKTTMKNSIIPEAEQIRKANAFIDDKEQEIIDKDKERVNNAFIDLDSKDDNDNAIES